MPQRSNSKSMAEREKPDGLSPRNAVRLDTLGAVRSEMSRLYRLSLRGKLEPEMMTKFIYTLKEIRCCIEAETTASELADIQRRIAALTAGMGGRNG